MGLTDEILLSFLRLPQTPETARGLREALRKLQRALEEVDLAIVNADGRGYHLQSTRQRQSWPDPQLVVLALIKYGLMEPDLVPDGFLSSQHDSECHNLTASRGE
jgi:hypothetical protein